MAGKGAKATAAKASEKDKGKKSPARSSRAAPEVCFISSFYYAAPMALVGTAAAFYYSLLQSCMNSFRQGKSIHCRIISSATHPDLHLSTKLIIFYGKFGDIEAARKVFDGMPHRSIVSWTAMISGYSRNGRPQEALELFTLMLTSGARPNQFTYGSVVSACAAAGCGRSGEQVHVCVMKGRFSGDMFVQSPLMDMHLRCGFVVDARRLFSVMEKKDVVSWNALLRGFVERGHYTDALGLLSSMLREAMMPDHFTFGSALKASGEVGVSKVFLLTRRSVRVYWFGCKNGDK